MRILAPQEARSSQEAFARLRELAIRARETSAHEVS
jgi:hypothetical protein